LAAGRILPHLYRQARSDHGRLTLNYEFERDPAG